MRNFLKLAASLSTLIFVACNQDNAKAGLDNSEAEKSSVEFAVNETTEENIPAPSPQEAKEFLESAEKELSHENERLYRISWIKDNFINYDTEWLLAKEAANYSKLQTRLANEAKRYNELELPADMTRKLKVLKTNNPFPAPDRENAAEELSILSTKLASTYSKGKFNYQDAELTLGELSDIIATSRDPNELKTVWEGWREISVPMKTDYTKIINIANEGSRELGYNDTGDLWRASYDMEAEAFSTEIDRLWGQVKPLYDQLHCYVRAELNKEYGDGVVPLDQPIRADLLGNMWAQNWGNIYPLVQPENLGQGVDITTLLQKNEYSVIDMIKTSEDFFTSIGLAPLPETFWERSLFVKPADREVACHASAWDVDNEEDLRIKMCTKINGEDFITVHHELGHNYYQRAYKDQPFYYKDGANDGFHEAIGDMIALSITPEYLVKIGLLDSQNIPKENEDIALLMRQALERVAFLPFGIMIDQWRWKAFSGEITPDEYNSGWWQLREKYQGIRPPSERPANAFDPGAKYHIPNNVPYMRYFIAHILQFQFHKAACELSGNTAPLHRCSIYGDKLVGEKFNTMMEMGSSKPWPQALEAFTGTQDMDGSAILEYFSPLMIYLEKENSERTCGW